MMVMSASELTTLSPTSCGKGSAYLDDCTKKKPAILTSRALISLPISNEPNEGRPVDDVNKTHQVDPQGVQPEKSTGRAALLEEMSWRCGDHLPIPRLFAFTEDGLRELATVCEVRAFRRNWLIRTRDEINQQIAELDGESPGPSPSFLAFGETMAQALGEDA